MNNSKAPSCVDDKTQQRLTLAGMFAHSVSVIPDGVMEYLLKNEHRMEIPQLVACAGFLGEHQRIVFKESLEKGQSRIAIPGELAREWELFWKTEYGIKADFAGLVIPPAPFEYKARLLVMHEKASQAPEMLFQSDKKAYGGRVWKFTDGSLDEAVPKHALIGTFSAWVSDVQEAPDGCVGGINLNTAAVDEIGWITETLPMRQVHGRKHFRQHAEHLDQKVITFCAGSRLPGGGVPDVCFRGGCVRVDAFGPQNADDCVRFRRAGV